jgi:hypothetical protein
MKLVQRIAWVLFAVLVLAVPAAAWDFPGHAAVAAIAWGEMTQEARAETARLLAAAPADSDLGPDFAAAAFWPDVVRDSTHPSRKERYDHGDWHYVNLFFDMEGPGGTPRERPDVPRNGHALVQIERLSRVLADRSVPDGERAVALAWIEHLTGDLHQPLHATARIDAHNPQGDRGGNGFPLHVGDLHDYWDDSMSRGYWRWFWESDADFGERIGERIAALHPRSSFPADLEPENFEGWAEDSFELAKTQVHDPVLERGRRPPLEYERKTTRIARERIALAGYRLADLLNALLAP